MKQNIKILLEKFRQEMQKNGLNAYLVFNNDPHLSEYPADHWKMREWISGFNGSAGYIALTMDDAALFTDSRYFLQAAAQLEGTGIALVKMGLPGQPVLSEWLKSKLPENAVVGFDPWSYSANDSAVLRNALKDKNITLRSAYQWMYDVWTDRPAFPLGNIYTLPVEFAGASASQKIEEVQKQMKKQDCDYLLISALDEIAWLFNIRGNDVAYNPVAVAYAIVTKNESIIFIHPEKLNGDEQEYFRKENVLVAEYGKVETYLKKISAGSKIWLDVAKTNSALYDAMPAGCIVYNAITPVSHMKSIKNDVEIEGFRRAMISDGIALVKFFIWLEENVGEEEITECTITEKLKEFRGMQELFVGESFGTIAGYNDHGAIVHYSATPETAYSIKKEGILLIDSGAQYFYGTTDITRTVALGIPTEEQKKDFTLVLKGNIGLATAVFPQNTRGAQIDILARKAMWEEGINYLHGTGHGIGHFLNVHEGPQSIRMEENSVVLKPGMVMSNEPGIYKEGKHGVRTENLILLREKETTPFGCFLCFDTLTLCPIDKVLINKDMLTQQELKWVNEYHQRVYSELSSGLNETEQNWLKEKTSAL